MEKDHIDPAFKYTDAKVKKLKSETDVKVKKFEGELTKVTEELLKQGEALLKETQMLDRTVDVLHGSILQTQRFLAKLQIRVVHNESLSHNEAYNKAQSQFISELTSAFIKVESSEQPLVVAQEFTERRWADLKKLGVEVLNIQR